MRRFSVVILAAVMLPTAASAQSTGRQTTSLSASTLGVVYGSGVSLSGTVSSHRPGQTVAILARPFTRGRMARIATVHTDGAGHWHYVARPSIATTYAASAGGNWSRTLMVGVRPALTLELLANGSLRADVRAARSFAGRKVTLQRWTGTWTTLARRQLDGRSQAIFPARSLPAGSPILRLGMSVNQAGSGYLGGWAKPVRYPALGVSLRLSRLAVAYGEGVVLSGKVYPRRTPLALTLLARPYMQAEFQEVRTIRPDGNGTWRLSVKPPFTTSYEVRLGTSVSRALTVGVRPAMTVRTLSGDRIWAHVGLAKGVAGRTVQMQRRVGGHWKTFARLTLGRRASAVFPPKLLPPGTSTLRTAISVNQVGRGYLGAFGKPFVYHR